MVMTFALQKLLRNRTILCGQYFAILRASSLAKTALRLLKPQNDFVKVLTRSYESFSGSNVVITELKLKTGEFLQIGGKRFQIIKLIISGENRMDAKDSIIEEMCSNINIFTNFDTNRVSFNIPLIL